MNTPKTGDELRDEGTAIVAANNAPYIERFHAAASKLLDEHGEVTSEQVTSKIGLPAGHSSAVGAAMRSFAAQHKLTVCNYIKSTRPKCHSAVIAVWTKLP